MTLDAPLITEDWLRDCGFKWEQCDRQPSKHWLLWIGAACVSHDDHRHPDSDALGIELAHNRDKLWYCWMRNDIAGRYSRVIHVRYVYLQAEVIAIIEALTGRKFDPRDSMYGSLRSPLQASYLREDRKRWDQRINHAWVDRVDSELGISGIDKDKRGVRHP